MTKVRVSIITPSFNQCVYLADALRSVEAQGWGERAEHIVCDGASTDGTVDMLQASGARWISEPDSGQSEALNKGFAVAQGDIIGWLNADDFYLAQAFDTVTELFDSSAGYDVVFADCVFVDANGRLLRGKAEHPFSKTLLRHYGCFIPSTSTFFRRELLDKGLLRIAEDFHFAMDYELFMRLAHSDVRFGYAPRYIAGFRWHESNKSLDDDQRLRERRLVQRTYGFHAPDASGASTSDKVWRVAHLGYKALTGGIARQMSLRSDTGTDMRWWLAEDA